MKRLIATVGALAALVACSVPPVRSDRSPTASASAADSPPAPATSASAEPSPRPETPPRFRSTVAPIPANLAAEMRGTTWRPGCPVPIEGLRLLTLTYWGFDGAVHEGPMVVNAGVARDIVWVFRQMFRARFPIKNMALSHRYRPKNDNPVTRKTFTASFNCRVVVTPDGPGTTLSMHSYGLAVDINSLQNPFVTEDGYTRNPHARRFVDRSRNLPGMIHEGDVVVRAFEHIGWVWGGHWSGGKDYMHFSSNGR